MDRLYRFIRTGWPFIGPFVTILALGGVFKLTPVDIYHTALLTLPTILTIPMGWLLLAVLSTYFTCLSIRYRSVVLTILELRLDLNILEPNGEEVEVVLEQQIRPHREDVTGYLRKVRVSGEVSKNSFDMHISHARKQEPQFDGKPSEWEIIHKFEGPIPVNPLRLGFDKAVTRKERYIATNSYTEAEEWHEIEIPREYRCRRFALTVRFHEQRPREAHDYSAIRITASGVVDLPVTPILEHPGAAVLKVERPRVGERYRLIWKRKPTWTPTSANESIRSTEARNPFAIG